MHALGIVAASAPQWVWWLTQQSTRNTIGREASPRVAHVPNLPQRVRPRAWAMLVVAIALGGCSPKPPPPAAREAAMADAVSRAFDLVASRTRSAALPVRMRVEQLRNPYWYAAHGDAAA